MQELGLALEEVQTQIVDFVHDCVLLGVRDLSVLKLLSFEQFAQPNMLVFRYYGYFVLGAVDD